MDVVSNPGKDEMIDVAAIGGAIASNIWKLLAVTALVAVVAFVVLTLMTPKYESQAQVLIQNNDNIYTKPQAENLRSDPAAQMSQMDVLSQLEILRSRAISRAVVADLNLMAHPEFNDALKEPGVIANIQSLIGLEGQGKVPLEEKILLKLEKSMRFQSVENTRVINVVFRSVDPALSAQLANGYADAYIRSQTERAVNQISGTDDWLGKQTEELRKQAEAAENLVEEHRRQSGITMSRNSETLSVQQLSELSTQLTLAKTEHSQAAARAAFARRMIDNGSYQLDSIGMNSGLIQNLTQQRFEVSRQLSNLASVYGDRHPTMTKLRSEQAGIDQQIRKEMRVILGGLENAAQIAKRRIETLEAELEAARSVSEQKGTAQAKLRILQREADSKRQLYEAYVARYGDTSARRSTAQSTIHAEIFQRAFPSYVPVSPRKVLILVLAVFATLFLGLALIITRALWSALDHDRVSEDVSEVKADQVGPGAPAVVESIDYPEQQTPIRGSA